MNPYLADWINRYLGAQFELGPYRPAHSRPSSTWRDTAFNEIVQRRPDLFAHITAVYGPDVSGLMNFHVEKREEFVYRHMFNYVLSTIYCSRDSDQFMVSRFFDLFEECKLYPAHHELQNIVLRLIDEGVQF